MTEPAERNLSPEELAEKFSGTMPVSDRYQTDLHALEQWMLAHVPGFEGPLSIEQFNSGIHVVEPDGRLLKEAIASGHRFVAYGTDARFFSAVLANPLRK
ncbi:MAG: hypothetical protein EBX02_09200 [Betaproteobacteria bacterium]|nr:hypothetical protein [Betaproteobacteria bacterium]